MRLAEAKIVGDILLAVKINKVKEPTAKRLLTKSYLAVRKAVREADSDREEIAKKFREDWGAEMSAEPKSEAYLKAEKEANEAIMELYDKDVEMTLEAVDAELLYDPDLWGENDTIGQIANSVDFLVRSGVARE